MACICAGGLCDMQWGEFCCLILQSVTWPITYMCWMDWWLDVCSLEQFGCMAQAARLFKAMGAGVMETFQWPLWMLGPHTETQVVCLWFSSWKKAHVTFPRALLGQFFEMHRMHSRFHSQQQQKLRVDSLGISGCWPLCIWPWMRHWYTTVPPCVPHALHPSLKEDVGLL